MLYGISISFSVAFSDNFKIIGVKGTDSYIGIIEGTNNTNKLPVSNILIFYENNVIPCSNSNQCDKFEEKVTKYLTLMNRSELIEYLEEVKYAWLECHTKFNGKCKYIGKEFWLGDDAFLYNLSLKRFNEKDFDIALTFATLAAENGYVRAQHFLGVSSDPRIKGPYPKDYKNAIFWYEKAAAKDWTSSLFSLAGLYLNGDGVKKSEKKYFYLLSRAVNSVETKDSVNAQFLLGEAFEIGIGTKIDYIQSLKWYEIAAKNGESQAMFNIGVFYTKGRGVKIDYCKAVKWYRKASDRGFPPAQHNLAIRYFNGQCVEKSYEKAISLLKKAAGSNYNLSKKSLAQLLR